VPEADRRFYAAAYARPGGMRAGFGVFHAGHPEARCLSQPLNASNLTRPNEERALAGRAVNT
jgi:hypothetical protein